MGGGGGRGANWLNTLVRLANNLDLLTNKEITEVVCTQNIYTSIIKSKYPKLLTHCPSLQILIKI